MEREGRVAAVSQGLQGGGSRDLFNGDGVLVWGDEKVLEMGGDGGCITK